MMALCWLMMVSMNSAFFNNQWCELSEVTDIVLHFELGHLK
jgi:hypothetical protein